MRKFFRTTYTLAVVFLFLAVALLGFTQTNVFRSYLRNLLIETVSRQLHGELLLGTVQGNLFTGFQVNDVVLRQVSDTVLTVKRVDAKYDPLGLLTKSVSVSRITLNQPVLYLVRSQTGGWNVGRLLQSSSPETGPSAWTINFKELQIRSGVVQIIDSLSLAERAADSSLRVWPGRLDYANIRLDSLELDAGISVRSREVSLSVRMFACRSPQVRIENFTGDFLLAPTAVSVQKLNVVTERSHLRLDARLDSVDITRLTDLAQLESVPISARLNVERLDFGELKQFVGSPVKFLERDASCQIDLAGRFGRLDVRNLTLHTGSSVVRISGTLTNLHKPADLELDLACVHNRVDPVDVDRLMPTVRIPDFTALGVVDYDLWFKGKPTVFNARVNTSSHVGSIDFDGSLDFREPLLAFDGSIRTTRLNLASLLGDSALSSSVHSAISLHGRGTRLATMTCVAWAEIDSSRFYGLPVSRSVAVVDMSEGTVHPRLSLRIGSSRIDVGGTLKVHPDDLVSYDLNGRTNSLNLAELTKKTSDESDFSFDLEASGGFKSLEAFSADLKLNFFRSTFDTVQFAGGPARLRINTLDQLPRTLNVASDILDLDVEGHFTLSTVASALLHGTTLVGEALQYRFNSLDTVRSDASDQRALQDFHSSVPLVTESTEYKFTLNVKDCFSIGVVLGKDLDGRLSATGRVSEGPGGVVLAGNAQVPEFRYVDKGLNFAIEEGNVRFDIGGLSQASLLQSMALSIGARAKRFEIANLRTTGLVADITMHGDRSTFDVAALLDSIATVRARGSGWYARRLLMLDIEHMEADFKSYVFQNPEPIKCVVGHDGLQLMNLSMRHDAEVVSVSGYFVPAGISNLALSVHNLMANNLPKAIRRASSVESLPAISGVLNATGTFYGHSRDPRFSAELNATGVRFETQTFGSVLIRASYADRLLNIFAELRSRPDVATAQPELLVSGTVPFDLSSTEGPVEKLEGEMNLDVHSSNFPLELLDPFISELSNVSGFLVCDMKLRGTIESPSYEGSVVLRGARFLFNPIGIQYIVDGKMVPNGRLIALEGVIIRNVSEDRPDGSVQLSGNFSLDGLKIKDFDLAANGQLLVMKETIRRTPQALYGDLFAGTGPEGVRWKGSPSRSFVNGEILVKSANLTLPPTGQTQDAPNSGIEVRLIDDANDTSAAAKGKVDQKILNPSTRPKKGVVVAPDVSLTPTKSFLDNIIYNLSIETQGVTQLRFVFSNFTNEQLLAELKGKTAFTKDGDQIHLTGELELGNRSYYSNFKKLAATGKVSFTGDPLSPELDVVATYEGTRRDTTGLGSGGGSRLSRGAVKVVVKIYISGTRDQPKVKMGLAEYDQLGNLLKERPDMEGDAIAFLVTGSFRDELTQQDKISLAGSSVVGGVASSILSGPLTDLLRKEFGIIRSVDVLFYGGGSFQESADVRLTGEVGDAVFRLGGRVLSDLNNTNVSVQLPMSAIVGSEKWRNLVLEAERTVLGVETLDQRRESKGIRLLYRIIF